jgi:DNA gyrase subunit A
MKFRLNTLRKSSWRHLNREYILKRINEIESLENEIADLEQILASDRRKKTIIIKELEEVIKKYDTGRKSKFCLNYPMITLSPLLRLRIIPLLSLSQRAVILRRLKPQICV